MYDEARTSIKSAHEETEDVWVDIVRGVKYN